MEWTSPLRGLGVGGRDRTTANNSPDDEIAGRAGMLARSMELISQGLDRLNEIQGSETFLSDRRARLSGGVLLSADDVLGGEAKIEGGGWEGMGVDEAGEGGAAPCPPDAPTPASAPALPSSSPPPPAAAHPHPPPRLPSPQEAEHAREREALLGDMRLQLGLLRAELERRDEAVGRLSMDSQQRTMAIYDLQQRARQLEYENVELRRQLELREEKLTDMDACRSEAVSSTGALEEEITRLRARLSRQDTDLLVLRQRLREAERGMGAPSVSALVEGGGRGHEPMCMRRVGLGWVMASPRLVILGLATVVLIGLWYALTAHAASSSFPEAEGLRVQLRECLMSRGV